MQLAENQYELLSGSLVVVGKGQTIIQKIRKTLKGRGERFKKNPNRFRVTGAHGLLYGMDQKEFDRLLERYLQGDASESEKVLVDRWYHRITHSKISITRTESAEIRKRLQSVLHANKSKSSSETVVSRPVHSIWRAFALPAAVCLASILIASFLFLTDPADVAHKMPAIAAVHGKADWNTRVNNTSSSQLIALDDGSKITLSPGTVLEYPLRFDAHSREVRLQKGSAFFSIQKDATRPFNVYSSEVVTSVLGTSFCINADAQGRVTVDVKTGTVKVSTLAATTDESKSEDIILRPNQRADYDPIKHTIVRTLVERPRVVLPSQEVENMTFDKAPVASILQAVEKAYQVEIRFDSVKLSSCALTTHLIPDEDLYTRLKIICEAIDAKYILVDGHILINAKGCQRNAE
jgi:transmembrane sensor